MSVDDNTRKLLRGKIEELIQQETDEARAKSLREYLAEFDRQAELDLSAAALAASSRVSAFDKAMNVLQSAPFYFLSGCIFLALAFIASHLQLNSSLTFLVAMLGMAVLLYGTGSQAAGSFGGRTDQVKALLELYAARSPRQHNREDLEKLKAALGKGAGSGTANVVIAGGAAVLTAVFGFGVVYFQNDIRQVLRDWDRYTVVRLAFCDSGDDECKAGADSSGLILVDNPAILRRGILLETDLGHRAFGRVSGGGLEFIVFERDWGSRRALRLLADPEVVDKSTYVMDDDYFVLTADTQCVSRKVIPNTCSIEVEQSSTPEVTGMPVVTIRLTVFRSAPVTAVADPTAGADARVVASPDPFIPS